MLRDEERLNSSERFIEIREKRDSFQRPVEEARAISVELTEETGDSEGPLRPRRCLTSDVKFFFYSSTQLDSVLFAEGTREE